jgi:hypothetical protein
VSVAYSPVILRKPRTKLLWRTGRERKQDVSVVNLCSFPHDEESRILLDIMPSVASGPHPGYIYVPQPSVPASTTRLPRCSSGA